DSRTASHDAERLARTQTALREAGLRALVCRMPENIVMLASYWPVIGRSSVVVPAEGNPVLVAPAMEQEALERALVGDVRTFPVWKLDDPAPDDSLERLLADALDECGASGEGLRVGVDGYAEDVSSTQKVLEPWGPSPAARDLVMRALRGAEAVDASDLLSALRARKTPTEVDRIRTAAEIGVMGLTAFFEAVAPGRREHEIAADVERAVLVGGIGYRGTRHARAQAVVFSGEARLQEFGWGFGLTSDRRIQPGDVVMLELSVVADGYYADLTRVRVSGRASDTVREVHAAVLEAYRAALAAVKPGAACSSVDAAARRVLDRAGLGAAFIHHTGHGLGFHYHEGVPFLHPDVNGPLAPGMVTSVEPGVYGPGYGGIRLEDDVLVTE
ncbi:MAG: aminopeptidase P family protein, partial [Dactylosporangium sp.]|nr:aminopeptidase P family protein [Dactylosporangium sp.]